MNERMSEQFWSIGECMLELRAAAPHVLHTAAAGDTFNTAVYLKRLMPALPVRYVSALGADRMSEDIRAQIRSHGVDDALVATLPGQLPGLYAIETDPTGERRFSYWRQQSAARSMLGAGHLAELRAALPACRAMLITGITLAILGDDQRAALLALAGELRARGGWVVVDSNYRPALWQADTARLWLNRALAIATHALLSVDDEMALHGDLDAGAVFERARRAGPDEVVIKLGADGCLVGGPALAPNVVAGQPVRALDTTAAGDSFNAGYLAGRLSGLPPQLAARLGCDLAGVVVAHPGAIIPAAAMRHLVRGAGEADANSGNGMG
ncbi:MAG: sugar kinase [Massilia sp.]